MMQQLHNHNNTDGYMLLSEIKENLKLYYEDLKNSDYNLMVEFVKDGTVENLKKDAKTLLNI